MTATANDRERLLGMLAERAYQYRPERPFTLRAAVPGVPCSALFTRAELQRRLEEQRAVAR